MKRTSLLLPIFLILIIPIFLGMIMPFSTADIRVKKPEIMIEIKPNLNIHEGYLSQKDETVRIKQKGKTVARVHLFAPVMVAKAEQNEEWGYFQFPSIGQADDGTLIVTWQMADDSLTAYGKISKRKNTPMMSKDDGKTWQPQDKRYHVFLGNYYCKMDNGKVLETYTPTSRNISSFKYFPKPVYKEERKSFFLIDSLPDRLKYIYFNLYNNNSSKSFQACVNDPGALRYSVDDLMPILWWGSIKKIANNSLMAGIYPSYLFDKDNHKVIECVSFYCSKDEGHSWDIVGKIPFVKDSISVKFGVSSFDEPAFEILADSTFICVMRTGSKSPMYKSFSYDWGKTWSQPVPFTPNGVRPWILKLKNGVLVLVSGRPGVQVRFSMDGKGENWTAPIDMIPFMHRDGSYALTNTCGYASIVEAGDNSFYMVYSDFTTRNLLGQYRKSIWFRKISVDKE